MRGRFCSLDQLLLKWCISVAKIEWRRKTRKCMVFAENCSVYSTKLGQDQKKKKQKRGLRRKLQCFATIFGRKFVESFSSGWLFFVWSSSTLLSMGGRLNLDGGRLNLDGGTLSLDGGTRPPYNLSTGFSQLTVEDNIPKCSTRELYWMLNVALAWFLNLVPIPALEIYSDLYR